MKILAIGLGLLILASGVFYIYLNQDNVDDDKPSINLLDNCPDFDFKKFIDTGGSKILRTTQDKINEVKRLQYICS